MPSPRLGCPIRCCTSPSIACQLLCVVMQSEHLARVAVRGVGRRMHESYWETVLYGDGGEDTKQALKSADEAVEVANDPRASLETLRDVRVQHVMDE